MAIKDGKNGHWYTDENGQHYFVEEGQTPKEGWEATKRRKMISGGKYMKDEGDGGEPVEITKEEYDAYEAEDGDFDVTVDDDFGFDEEEPNEAKRMIDEGVDVNDRDQVVGFYIDAYGVGQGEAERMADEFMAGNENMERTVPKGAADAGDGVSDIEIDEALNDYLIQVSDSTTVGEYAQSVADRLGVPKERVLTAIRNDDPNIKESDNMAKVAGLADEEEPEAENQQDDGYDSLHWGDQYTIDAIVKKVSNGDYPKTEQGIKKALRDFGGMTEKATEVLYKRLGVTPAGGIKNTLVDDMVGATPDPRRGAATPNRGDSMNPDNPRYKGFRPSSITNAKLVDEGETYQDFDTGKEEKLSIIEYIPYGSLRNGTKHKLYGVVSNYDGSDTFDGGAIVSPSLELAREDLKNQIELGRQGSERYSRRGKWDEDWFNMLNDKQYEWSDDDRKRYSDKYGWDFSKPWSEQKHVLEALNNDKKRKEKK